MVKDLFLVGEILHDGLVLSIDWWNQLIKNPHLRLVESAFLDMAFLVDSFSWSRISWMANLHVYIISLVQRLFYDCQAPIFCLVFLLLQSAALDVCSLLCSSTHIEIPFSWIHPHFSTWTHVVSLQTLGTSCHIGQSLILWAIPWKSMNDSEMQTNITIKWIVSEIPRCIDKPTWLLVKSSLHSFFSEYLYAFCVVYLLMVPSSSSTGQIQFRQFYVSSWSY